MHPRRATVALALFGVMNARTIAVAADPAATAFALEWIAPDECPSVETVRRAIARDSPWRRGPLSRISDCGANVLTGRTGQDVSERPNACALADG